MVRWRLWLLVCTCLFCGVARADAQQPAQPVSCTNPPTTADLRIVSGTTDAPVRLRVPGYRVEGCDDPGDPITVDVRWGDGTEAAASVEPVPGQERSFTIAADHQYAASGTYPIVLVQRNARTGVEREDHHYEAHVGWQDPGTCSVPPSDASLLVLLGAQGRAVELRATGALIDGCDVPGDPLAATVDWGDGSHAAASVATVPGDVRRYVVSGRHVYRSSGDHKIVITVRNTRSGVSREDHHYQASIERTGLVVDRAPLTGRIGRSLSGVVARLPKAGALIPVPRYVVRVDWGDGTHGTGKVVLRHGAFIIAGAHRWRRPIRRHVTVVLTDPVTHGVLRVRRPLRLRG